MGERHLSPFFVFLFSRLLSMLHVIASKMDNHIIITRTHQNEKQIGDELLAGRRGEISLAMPACPLEPTDLTKM